MATELASFCLWAVRFIDGESLVSLGVGALRSIPAPTPIPTPVDSGRVLRLFAYGAKLDDVRSDLGGRGRFERMSIVNVGMIHSLERLGL